MEPINLRYQVSLFGNYDDVVPNSENMKFFVEKFESRGLIPTQALEEAIDISHDGQASKKTMQHLTFFDSEKKWQIQFRDNILGISFVNANIGKTEMISIDFFISEVINILGIINEKFKKTYKRVGFVTQYLFKNDNLSDKFINAIDFFQNKQILGWSSNIASREKLIYEDKEEFVNVTSFLSFIHQSLQMNDKNTMFKGIVLNIDINTLHENVNYRFSDSNLKSFLQKILENENVIFKQTFDKII